MPFADIGEVRLCYERRGVGPRLVYIGGTGGDLRRVPGVLDGPLADAFEVLAYDQRGLGRSDKPDRPCSMRDYANDAAALAATLGWTRAHVVGVSFGGMVAQELALAHPSLVDRLVLCCTAAGGAGGASYPLHEIAHLDPPARARLRIGVSDTRLDDAWQRANPIETERLVAQQLEAWSLGADEPGHAVGAARQLEARAGHDTWDRIGAVTAPVLVCGGRYDGQARPEVVAALARRIPGARLAMFEGGHGFLQQDPAALAHIVRFLRGDE